MKFNIKKEQEGFTIIEVMIVLVIAAVILLIVFLAVPALQRNARNVQRKEDVAGVLAAFNENLNNSNGIPPLGIWTGTAGLVRLTQVTTVTATATSPGGEAKLGFFAPTDITYVVVPSSPATPTTNLNDVSKLQILSNSVCNGSNATNTGASTRQAVALYTLETQGANTQVCQAT